MEAESEIDPKQAIRDYLKKRIQAARYHKAAAELRASKAAPERTTAALPQFSRAKADRPQKGRPAGTPRICIDQT
jgi:hypothetical protein